MAPRVMAHEVMSFTKIVLLPTSVLLLLAACAANPPPLPTPTVNAINPSPSANTPAAEAPTATATYMPASTHTFTLAPAPTQTPTRQPAITAVPTPRITVANAVSPLSVGESSVTFAAYPYEKFLQTRRDPSNNFSFNALDRAAYDAAASKQGATSRTVRAVVLENEYLRLTFLPELGGRLFQITHKPTNQNVLYNNRVLKPTHWGPPNQGGWLAVGGMEWALPVNEHGYEWGVPWSYSVERDANGATITLRDSAATDRVRAAIQVTLPARAAYIVVHPRVENPTGAPQRLQFWLNAQIALAAKNVSPNTQFSLPASSVFIHSTGNKFIPRANVPRDDAASAAAPVAWPNIAGRDFSRYANWDNYLGMFVANPTTTFVGAYNYDSALGVARVFPPQSAPGVKLFAFGTNFCCRGEIGDDGSDYFEIWGGLPRTFFANDDVTLAPGEAREWSEYWLAFAGTGGLSAATRDAILALEFENGNAQVGAYSALARSGTLILLRDGSEIKRWAVTLTPHAPFTATTPASATSLSLRLVASDGTVIAQTTP